MKKEVIGICILAGIVSALLASGCNSAVGKSVTINRSFPLYYDLNQQPEPVASCTTKMGDAYTVVKEDIYGVGDLVVKVYYLESVVQMEEHYDSEGWTATIWKCSGWTAPHDVQDGDFTIQE